MRIRFLGFAALALPFTLAAQTKLGGQWTVRYTRASVNMHTRDTSVVEETAQMILHPRGDSIFGFWQMPADQGESLPPVRTIRGVIRGDTARVQVDQVPHDDDGFFAELGRDIVEFLKTHIHNMPTTIPLLEFTVRGDSLVGTRRSITLDGTVTAMPPRPLSGVRR